MTADTICTCGHWFEEHDTAGCSGCDAAGLEMAAIEHKFTFDAEASSPEAIADRGGDPSKWPQRVKDHFARRP